MGRLPGWKTYRNQETFCVLLPVFLITLVSNIKIGHDSAMQTYHIRPSVKLSWSHRFHWKINLMPLCQLCDTFFLGQISQTTWRNGLVRCGKRWRVTDDNSWAFFTLSKTSHTVHLIRKCHLRDLRDLGTFVGRWSGGWERFCYRKRARCCVSVNEIAISDHSGFTDHQWC